MCWEQKGLDRRATPFDRSFFAPNTTFPSFPARFPHQAMPMY